MLTYTIIQTDLLEMQAKFAIVSFGERESRVTTNVTLAGPNGAPYDKH